jgi:hypothetical protein
MISGPSTIVTEPPAFVTSIRDRLVMSFVRRARASRVAASGFW